MKSCRYNILRTAACLENVGEPSLGLGTMSQGDTKVPPGSTAGNQPHYHPSQVVSKFMLSPSLVVVTVVCPADWCSPHLAGW